MKLKRVHVFEFEDASWLPDVLRRYVRDLIVVANRVFGVTDGIQHVIGNLLKEGNFRRVVDLGSGSGGAMPEVVQALRRSGLQDLELVLTDKYPDQEAISRFEGEPCTGINYKRDPVDATDLSGVEADFYTMINSFHHMKPGQAQRVLQAVVNQNKPVLIVEMADNKLPFWLWVGLLPLGILMNGLMAMVMTLKIRPLSFQRAFLTYCIPIVPMLFAWDGQASYPRIYGFSDIDALITTLNGSQYTWDRGYAKRPGQRSMAIYLYGKPVRKSV